MNEEKMIYLANREDWRAWLEKHHASEAEIWLIYYKKHTGITRIAYDDAVEEALCFGWIDSTVKRIDDEKYAQKFTPRNERSRWSQLNLKRAEKMIQAGLMTKIGLEKYKNRIILEEKKEPISDANNQNIIIPADLIAALKSDPIALKNFDQFAPSYKKMYISWIDNAKRAETRAKRIQRVVEFSFKNIKSVMM